MVPMLTLTESRTCQGTEAWINFVDAEHQKNVIFEEILSMFKSNSSPEDDVTETKSRNGRTHFSCSF